MRPSHAIDARRGRIAALNLPHAKRLEGTFDLGGGAAVAEKPSHELLGQLASQGLEGLQGLRPATRAGERLHEEATGPLPKVVFGGPLAKVGDRRAMVARSRPWPQSIELETKWVSTHSSSRLPNTAR